jgi:Uma2 family endonuclease
MMMLTQAKPPRRAPRKPEDESRRITYAQFLRMDLPNPHAEWVDGKVIEMPPISSTHNDLGGFFITCVGIWVEAHDLGELKYEPFQMKTGPDLPGRSPDILFVAKKNLSRLKKNYLDGPADMVIEIVSEGSRSVDRSDKYYEYEKGGVREYWLIDPLRKQAEFYRLDRTGIYRLIQIADDGIFRSEVLKGLWLKVAWLWQKPLPSVLAVQREWKL